MLRIAATLGVVAMLAAAFALHIVTYKTRALVREVRQAEGERDKLREEIAILRADKAFLARPGRIEAVAREFGMRPARIDQLPRAQSSLVEREQPQGAKTHRVGKAGNGRGGR